MSCELLGPVSLGIQMVLGAFSIGSLVLKRNAEFPKRPWKIWVFDVSKQVVGSAFIHVVNLTISLLRSHAGRLLMAGGGSGGSAQDQDGDQCDWYFLNLLMDTTIGVPLLYVLLTVVHYTASRAGLKVQSGYYGTPPQLKLYAQQLCLFLVSLMLMKLVVFELLKLDFWIDLADWVLNWSDRWPNLQVFLVMFVSPIVLNCVQFYFIDNIVKL